MKRLLMTIAVLLPLAACEGSNGANRDSRASPQTMVAPDITLDEVYANMLAALDGGGRVSHVTIRQSTESNIFMAADTENRPITIDMWFDIEQQSVRREFKPDHLATPPGQDIMIGLSRFQVPSDDRGGQRSVQALVCRDTRSPALSALAGCNNYIEESESHVEVNQTFEGVSGYLAIVTKGDAPGHDNSLLFTAKLIVNPDDWLPVAATFEGVADFGPQDMYEVRWESRYEHEYRDEAPSSDFFSPAEIGYERSSAEQRLGVLHPDTPAFWIDRSFTSSEASLALELYAAHFTGDGDDEPLRLGTEIDYSAVGIEHPAIAIRAFARTAWHDLLALPDTRSRWWDGVPMEEHLLGGRRVVLITGGDSPTGSQFAAHVYMESAVVEILPFADAGKLDSREALLIIAGELRVVDVAD